MASAIRARVLVIDDSQTVLRVMEGVLSQAGCEVTCLESGRDVVEAARHTRPDLIFVDFAMPEVNGYGVCKLLGEHADLETIPIVVMNTRGDPVGERFIRDMGIVDHISKPFAPEALLAVAQHILDKTRGTDPALRRRPVTPAQPPAVSVDADALARQALAARLAEAVDGTRTQAQRAARLEEALAETGVVALMHELGAGAAAL
ncbi:MAG: response regulator, partial [Deltaproteobacteria bacterium]|nr:response regulator [Deltaproteobacteria bacterium]